MLGFEILLEACAQQPETIESLRHGFRYFISFPFLQKFRCSSLDKECVGESTNVVTNEANTSEKIERCKLKTFVALQISFRLRMETFHGIHSSFPFNYYSAISYLFQHTLPWFYVVVCWGIDRIATFITQLLTPHLPIEPFSPFCLIFSFYEGEISWKLRKHFFPFRVFLSSILSILISSLTL